jgi:hypothetical protein
MIDRKDINRQSGPRLRESLLIYRNKKSRIREVVKCPQLLLTSKRKEEKRARDLSP